MFKFLFLCIGVSECDKKRNKTSNPEIVIVLPEGGGDGGKGAENKTFVPVVPTWPTDSGITKEEATKKCREKLKRSTIYR